MGRASSTNSSHLGVKNLPSGSTATSAGKQGMVHQPGPGMEVCMAGGVGGHAVRVEGGLISILGAAEEGAFY